MYVARVDTRVFGSCSAVPVVLLYGVRPLGTLGLAHTPSQRRRAATAAARRRIISDSTRKATSCIVVAHFSPGHGKYAHHQANPSSRARNSPRGLHVHTAVVPRRSSSRIKATCHVLARRISRDNLFVYVVFSDRHGGRPCIDGVLSDSIQCVKIDPAKHHR